MLKVVLNEPKCIFVLFISGEQNLKKTYATFFKPTPFGSGSKLNALVKIQLHHCTKTGFSRLFSLQCRHVILIELSRLLSLLRIKASRKRFTGVTMLCFWNHKQCGVLSPAYLPAHKHGVT